MGHDIDIISVLIVNGKAQVLCVEDTAYMSYNWSTYCKACPDHFPEKCECDESKFVTLWHVDDFIGRSGKYVFDHSQKALHFMMNRGIYPSSPDSANSNWGWGMYKVNGVDQEMPRRMHAAVFAYHVRRFAMLGMNHKDCYFRGDRDLYSITDDDGREYYLEDSEESEESDDDKDYGVSYGKNSISNTSFASGTTTEEETSKTTNAPQPFSYADITRGFSKTDHTKVSTKPSVTNSHCNTNTPQVNTNIPAFANNTSIVTYFRHPSKGNFRVHNFKTAIEVYGVCVSKDDPRAEAWYELAMKMHDAPGKK